MDHHSHSAMPTTTPANPQAIKRRRRTTKHELAVLEALYAESRNPSYEARQEACLAIGFEMKALQVWLQNRRQKEKKDAGKWKPSYTATGESAASTSTTLDSSIITDIHTSNSGYTQSSRSSSSSSSSSISASPVMHSLPPSSSSSIHARHDQHNNTRSLGHVVEKYANPMERETRTHDTVILPPIRATASPALNQGPITLPSISSLIPSNNPLSRDGASPGSSREENNTLSPILDHRSEGTRPSLKRTHSADSTHSSLTSSTTLESTMNTTEQLRSHLAPLHTASIIESTTRPTKQLRRTSSQYSLSIAQDGKAEMKMMLMTERSLPPIQLPSSASAILARSMTTPSSICSSSPAPGGISPAASQASSNTLKPLSLASAPLSTSLNKPPISSFSPSIPTDPSKVSNPFNRVYSLPSLSTLSTSAASIRSKSTLSLFAGGLRPGSPPKKSTMFPSLSSTSSSSHQLKRTHAIRAQQIQHPQQQELWENLDSDPIEPEDEILANHNKRMMESPIRRNSSIRMEDILSSSRKKRKGLSHVSTENVTVVAGEKEVEKAASVFGMDKDLAAPSSIVPAAPYANTLAGSATTANILSGNSSSPSKPSSTTTFSSPQPLARLGLTSTTSNNLLIPNRKRSYSKSMLSRSISLDRVILHDDSTDEESSPKKKHAVATTAPVGSWANVLGRSTTTIPPMDGANTGLGRPTLVRANTHLGTLALSSATDTQQRASAAPVKRMSLDVETALAVKRARTITAVAITADEEEQDASGEEDSASMMTTTSPIQMDTSTPFGEEPDLSFSSNEASQSHSFDGMSRGDISEVETEPSIAILTSNSKLSGESENGELMDIINDKLDQARYALVTSTPKKKTANATIQTSTNVNSTLALAALKGHMSSPIKMGSPRKILTEVERDCAAVLVGLGIPDVF